jgi:hypothetical protein
VVLVLAVVTAGVIAAFAFVLWFHEYVASITRLRAFLNANAEANFPAWWNATLLLLVAFCAFTARVQEPDKARRRAWLLVAVAGLSMSMDEITSLHERLNGVVLSAGLDPRTFPWLIPGVFIAGTGFLLLVRVGRALPNPARGALLLALTSYAAGAIGVEALNGLLRETRHLFYCIGTAVEESLEMSSCILAVGAIINQVTTRRDTTPPTADPIRVELSWLEQQTSQPRRAQTEARPSRIAAVGGQVRRNPKVPTLQRKR